MRRSNPLGSVVDLFCGAGGLTHGLRLENFRVTAGVDVDHQCRYAYEHNNNAKFIHRDIDDLTADELVSFFVKEQPRILVGCAPCQPFSIYNQKNNDPNWRLLRRFGELIVQTKPDVVSMENVPSLLNFRGGDIFNRFRQVLVDTGYYVYHRVVFLPEYGLPQYRSRLVLMASLHGALELENPTFKCGSYRTVEQAIGSLPPIAAGETDPNDPLHSASRLSVLNLKRIRASMPGGSWEDWDEELLAECHKANTGKGYKSVYGRMKLDEPSPTITTQFFGFGNGRFGHPEQDRALSLREGAILQSFPSYYEFIPSCEQIQIKVIGRMIGNAVPVLLGQVIGRSISSHLLNHGFSQGLSYGQSCSAWPSSWHHVNSGRNGLSPGCRPRPALTGVS